MKLTELNFIKTSIGILMIILGISTMLDLSYLYRGWRDLNFLDNYISFETKNVINKKEKFIRLIQTTIEFYSKEGIKRYNKMLNVEAKDAKGLEDVILSWHHEVEDFDSLPTIADRLLINNTDVLNAKDHRIRSFYELRYVQELLNYLSLASRPTGSGCYFGFDIARSVGEDSVYIGNYGLANDHIKYALKLNGLFFSSNFEGIYKIPWSDKLNAEMFIMTNRETYIDTTIQKQSLVKKGNTWRTASEVLPAKEANKSNSGSIIY